LKEESLSKRVTAVSFALAFAVFAGPSAVQARQVEKPIIYSVQAGDSLWAIASRSHMSVATIEALNHLTDASILQLGQTIVIGERTLAVKPTASLHHAAIARAVRHASRRRVVAHNSVQTPASAQQVVATQALWAATHVGPTPPAIFTPLGFATAALRFDARITNTALRYLGVPYEWGGTSFGGVDCSGFVWAVFAKNGIELPRTADAQFEFGRHVPSRDLRPGDLVFFQTYAPGASHVGIYLGNGKFVHASSSNGVRVDALAEDYYSERYIGARRLAKV
jgi:cell wall-associated NlpC family hydrolase